MIPLKEIWFLEYRSLSYDTWPLKNNPPLPLKDYIMHVAMTMVYFPSGRCWCWSWWHVWSAWPWLRGGGGSTYEDDAGDDVHPSLQGGTLPQPQGALQTGECSGWAWFGRSLWPHYLFLLQHLKETGENEKWILFISLLVFNHESYLVQNKGVANPILCTTHNIVYKIYWYCLHVHVHDDYKLVAIP